MKIANIQKNYINENNKDLRQNQQNPQFKSVDGFLRFLATNQAVGANLVDLSFMVIPRTTTDMVSRGPAAGMETARREATGTVNHSLIGLYGIGAGAVAASLMGIDNEFGIKANNIFTAPETLDILAQNKANQIKKNGTQLDYLKETLSNLKAYNPTADASRVDKDGFVKLLDTEVDEIAKILDEVISDTNVNYKNWTKSKTPLSRDVVANMIIEKTGSQSKFVLESADKKLSSTADLKTVLDDIFKVSESFNQKKVVDAFKEQVKNNKGIKDNSYMKSLHKFMKSRAAAGFAIATAIGMSIQPLNVYITKLKTGSDGFVGVEGRSKDDSTGFKVLKGISGAAFFAMVLGTLQTGLKGFMDKMAFKGSLPTINQLKGIYGLTIVSRILATRDKDELREALTKDTLGFLSWLVLGDFVNKAAASAIDKSVMNNKPGTENAKGFIEKTKRLFSASLKTRDEILIETLAGQGIKSTKQENGKLVAKSFKELMKDLETLKPELQKATKKRLGALNKAQLAGYLFSGLVLGLGIPNLNIYITNTLDKKRKAKAAEEAQKQQAVV